MSTVICSTMLHGYFQTGCLFTVALCPSLVCPMLAENSGQQQQCGVVNYSRRYWRNYTEFVDEIYKAYYLPEMRTVSLKATAVIAITA